MNDELIGALEFDLVEGGIVEHIVDMLGIAFMRKLATCLGGQEIKLPKSPETLSPGHRLVQALGMEDATRLCEIFSGELISIPKGKSKRLSKDSEYLIAAFQEGKSVAEIANTLGVTMRQVRRKRRNLGLPPRRPGLSGLPETSGPTPRPDNENRPSGLQSSFSTKGKSCLL